jgi:CheY-like chemotaxis protein
VVEGNAVNRMLIGTYVEEFGLTHEMVDSGGGAVMNLATKTYDLVLMDIMMPDLDGIETPCMRHRLMCRSWRSSPRR